MSAPPGGAILWQPGGWSDCGEINAADRYVGRRLHLQAHASQIDGYRAMNDREAIRVMSEF